MPLRSSEDIVRVRQAVRNWAVDLGFGLVDGFTSDGFKIQFSFKYNFSHKFGG